MPSTPRPRHRHLIQSLLRSRLQPATPWAATLPPRAAAKEWAGQGSLRRLLQFGGGAVARMIGVVGTTAPIVAGQAFIAGRPEAKLAVAKLTECPESFCHQHSIIISQSRYAGQQRQTPLARACIWRVFAVFSPDDMPLQLFNLRSFFTSASICFTPAAFCFTPDVQWSWTDCVICSVLAGWRACLSPVAMRAHAIWHENSRQHVECERCAANTALLRSGERLP